MLKDPEFSGGSEARRDLLASHEREVLGRLRKENAETRRNGFTTIRLAGIG